MRFLSLLVFSECQSISSLNSFSAAVPWLLESPLHVGTSALLKLCAPGGSRRLDPRLQRQRMSRGVTRVPAEPGAMSSVPQGRSPEAEEPAWIREAGLAQAPHKVNAARALPGAAAGLALCWESRGVWEIRT